jgi:hypothetical protein
MIDCLVRVTVCLEIPVRRPAITYDVSAGFDPGSKNIHQGVSDSVRNGNKKRFPGLALNTAKHALPLNRVAPVVFVPTELSLVDFDGLVRTADLLRAALQITNMASLQNWSQSAIILEQN